MDKRSRQKFYTYITYYSSMLFKTQFKMMFFVYLRVVSDQRVQTTIFTSIILFYMYTYTMHMFSFVPPLCVCVLYVHTYTHDICVYGNNNKNRHLRMNKWLFGTQNMKNTVCFFFFFPIYFVIFFYLFIFILTFTRDFI